MRVVHYAPYMFAAESGTGIAARGWAKAIQGWGIQVVALVDGDAMHLTPPEDILCVPLAHRLRGKARVPVGLPAFLDEMNEGDVLVLHGGWLLRNVVVGSAAARRGIPYVVTAHGVYNPPVLLRRRAMKRLWATALERRQVERALAVHLFFDEEREGLRRLGVQRPTIVVPNGIETPTEKAWDGGSGGYLLWLGRYDPYNKGLDLLVRAVHQLPDESRPTVRLHGPDWRGQKRFVTTLVRELDLDDWISVGDPIYGDAKWDLITRAAGCVYPSRWEGCSVFVLEAVSLGVPTLVGSYALGRLLAGDGAAIEVGWTVPELTNGLLRLLSTEANEIGRRAAEVARIRFSWSVVAESWLRQLVEIPNTSRS